MNGLLFIKWLSKPGKGNISIHSCTTDSQGQELFVFLHSRKKEKKDYCLGYSILYIAVMVALFAIFCILYEVTKSKGVCREITVWIAGIGAWGNEAASQLLTISPDIEPLPLESNRPRPTHIELTYQPLLSNPLEQLLNWPNQASGKDTASMLIR